MPEIEEPTPKDQAEGVAEEETGEVEAHSAGDSVLDLQGSSTALEAGSCFSVLSVTVN